MQIIKSKSWRTDEVFGYPHWRSAEYSCGEGTHHSIQLIFDSEQERDNHLALLKDEQVKLEMVKG